MKKLIILLAFICFLSGGIGTAYYFGVFDNEIAKSEQHVEQPDSKPVESESDTVANEILSEPSTLIPQKNRVEAYYVSQATTAIRINPDPQAPEDGVVYYGEKLIPQDIKGDWIRIAPIYQLEPESQEISQWVKLSDLSEDKVPLSGDEWTQILEQYLQQSDDYLVYNEEFLQVSTDLLQQGDCRLADFEQVGGWVKSINYPKDVYFTYCGGLDLRHKKYFNVASRQIF